MGRRFWHGWGGSPGVWVDRFRRRVSSWYQRQEATGAARRAQRPQHNAGPWHKRRWLDWLAGIGAAIFLAWVVFAFLMARSHRDGWWKFTPATWCDRKTGFYCGIVVGFVNPFLAIAFGFAVFLLFRYLRTTHWYLGRARRHPSELVLTAERDSDDVVGREELCEVLIERIRTVGGRCPVVLIGGVGTGKTALLVSLTRTLARRGVVAIPLRMRDITEGDKLDFEARARDRFLAEVSPRLFSDADADRTWRQLRRQNRIAVLADGLEEVMESGDQRARDSTIRDAIQTASDNDLPLVIASRPYDPLRGMSAITVPLEPLGMGPALRFVLDDREAAHVRTRVAQLAEAVDAVDSPLLLRIIHDLARIDRLGDPDDQTGEATRPDRPVARLSLLDTWLDALVDGHLYEDFTHDRRERESMVEVLSALACLGMSRRSAVVTFAELRGPSDDGWTGPVYPGIRGRLKDRLDAIGVWRLDDPDTLDLAAVAGGEMNLVRAERGGVRFQHGLLQAYLGVSYLDVALADDHYWDRAFAEPGPMRELLIALALLPAYQRRRGRAVPPVRRWARPLRRHRQQDGSADVVHRLLRKVGNAHNNCRKIEMYAAAVEMAGRLGPEVHDLLARKLHQAWPEFQESETAVDRPLDEAKLVLVRRLGECARRPGRSPDTRPAGTAERAHRCLYQLAGQEESYRIRLAAVREIGLGGAIALQALRPEGGTAPLPVTGSALTDQTDRKLRREQQIRGWLAPLLYLSASADSRDDRRDEVCRLARQDLLAWLEALGQPACPSRYLGITSEFALAQGFRLAANQRRFRGRPEYDKSRCYLVEKAEHALARSRFWFSQLALLQALTLLSLPDEPDEPLPAAGRGSDPWGLVGHWLDLAGSRVPPEPGRVTGGAHPFVTAAGRLCAAALATRHPERFCWIDERETASRVGSCDTALVARREQQAWIPDSMGWSVLHPRAQRLLGDVMLLFNLADRGDTLAEREERLARADRPDLPPCLTGDRHPLEPDRSLHSAETSEPGATCLDDCRFRLCPLPAKGERLPQEMDENFCARQVDLLALRYRLRARAPWQAVPLEELRAFWRRMAERMLPAWRR